MHTMSRFATRLFLGLIVAGAAACGGGGDATAPSPAPGPGDGQEKAEIVPVKGTHGIGIFAQRCLGFTHSRAISTMIERGH